MVAKRRREQIHTHTHPHPHTHTQLIRRREERCIQGQEAGAVTLRRGEQKARAAYTLCCHDEATSQRPCRRLLSPKATADMGGGATGERKKTHTHTEKHSGGLKDNRGIATATSAPCCPPRAHSAQTRRPPQPSTASLPRTRDAPRLGERQRQRRRGSECVNTLVVKNFSFCSWSPLCLSAVLPLASVPAAPVVQTRPSAPATGDGRAGQGAGRSAQRAAL